MTVDLWQKVQEAFERVSAAPPEGRAALLNEACGDDAALRAEVESLLEHDSRAGDDFLASPIVELRAAEPSPYPLPEREGGAPDWALALVGRKIGRYTIARLIGHGGMGCVFEATQEQPARQVALKVLRPGFSAPAAVARFRLEPEVLGRLQHPNIAQVFEAGVHTPAPSQGEGWGEGLAQPIPYFAMELIPEAQPLIEFADANELTTRQRLELFAKVCHAVHHGHQKGIIHRDLKPGNILVGRDGEPKVIDFGVARATDSDIVLTTQYTHVGDLVGTLHYMSPEQCDGDPAAIDTRSDIYSLGVVLYELLTGTPPYETSGTTVHAAIRVIKDELPRRPSAINRRLRGDLDAILLKALEKDAERRYGAAADLAQDIRRHLAGEPIEARPPGPWRRVLRWAGRRPKTAAVISAAAFFTLVAGSTVVGATAYLWYYFRAPDAVRYDAEEPHRSALLISRKGNPVHTWRAGANGGLFAQWICPFPDDERRAFALIGYSGDADPKYAGQIRVYDVHTPDLDRPVWTAKITDADLPEAIRKAGHTADQFSPTRAWLFDVFPEAQPPRADEIVCMFAHSPAAWTALCIYSADGQPLYRVWHDGILGYCYWMAGPGRLVVTGDNWEKYPHERGWTEYKGGVPIAFALRPTRGRLSTALLDTSSAGADDLVWYKWLGVCPVAQAVFRLDPPQQGDPGQTANLALGFDTRPPCGMTWHIDADGNRIEGTLSAPLYKMARAANPSWPAPEEFRLEDAPPGEASEMGR